MVHDQKIHPSLGRLLDHRLGGIHRCSNSREAARVLDLKSIHGLWKVPDLSCAQEVIKVANCFGKVHGKTTTPEQAPIEVFSLKGFTSAHKLDIEDQGENNLQVEFAVVCVGDKFAPLVLNPSPERLLAAKRDGDPLRFDFSVCG
jgi:hypothetical protein